LAYIGLEPKSSQTIKYYQPFELVLFHVITHHIKFLKGSYYPYLLNNYLIDYLNFSSLTSITQHNKYTEGIHHIKKQNKSCTSYYRLRMKNKSNIQIIKS